MPISVAAITNTMRRYCNAGVTVQLELIPSPEHLSEACPVTSDAGRPSPRAGYVRGRSRLS
ncbi:hypothetical protein ERC79_01840 [Rhodococcus sp. ABRD24]|nr:hypothetical protein ERC79_01840 [Rhodococcus sp. ABRD24]